MAYSALATKTAADPVAAADANTLQQNTMFMREWATLTVYVEDHVVLYNNVLYICTTGHTAGTFATDLAAGKWETINNYAINDVFVQFPIAGSNTIATAFPVAQRPATRFGGTWAQIWETEAIFWKTEGDHHASETQNSSRTNGKQTQQIVDHYHNRNTAAAAEYYLLTSAGARDFTVGGAGFTSATTTGQASADGTHTLASGYENRPQNRLMLLWKRTA